MEVEEAQKRRRAWNTIVHRDKKDVWQQIRETENNQRILNNLASYSKLNDEHYSKRIISNGEQDFRRERDPVEDSEDQGETGGY